jgi:hypothetical protein
MNSCFYAILSLTPLLSCFETVIGKSPTLYTHVYTVFILRLTQDFKKAQVVLADLGLQPRLPLKASEVFEFREEYIRKRNLIAWSFVNPKNPAELVDLLLTHDLSKQQIVHFSILGEKIPVILITARTKLHLVTFRVLK